MKNKPAYIVIDTNVLISAGLLPHSKTAQVLALAVDAGASLLISDDPDLKDVRVHQGVEILSPALFFERFKPL
jgi:predicted nucleic acid-binding protein